MKTPILATILATTATLVTATSGGIEYVDGQFICPKDAPNGVFCSGTSLETDIIIRCNNGIGQPGRCSNNLVGQPPVGTGIVFARCWAPSANNGTAACEKNCVVYGSSGNFNGTFTLPGCQPTWPPLPPPPTSSSSSPSTTTAKSTTVTETEDCETTTTTSSVHTTEDCETTTTATSTHTTEDCETTTTTTSTHTTEDCETTTTSTPTHTTEDCETTTTTPTYTKPPHSWTMPPHHNTTVTYSHTKPPHTKPPHSSKPPYSTGSSKPPVPTGTGSSSSTPVTVTTITRTTSGSNTPVGPTSTPAGPTGPGPVPGAASGLKKGNSVAGLVFVIGVVGWFF
ncbi:hypothetical protein QBC43DRAFT_330109 [Cladorrhinum sp. PSN259]|nr:hypothetical protein QBC43DRAFT_330109 [Cladorrhinum sp. PSN259]